MTAETRSVYDMTTDAQSATYVRSTARAARSAAYVQSTEQGRANRLAGLGIGVTGHSICNVNGGSPRWTAANLMLRTGVHCVF